jgi:membrane-bound serine protease (ClpP class)
VGSREHSRGRGRGRRAQRLAGAALALLGACALGSACSEGDQAPAKSSDAVTHVRVEGALDAGTLSVLRRAIAHAEGRGQERLIVELDTPGGEIELMWKIARLLDDAPTDLIVVAWVHDHALSAGVLVALACDQIFMTPQAVIGAAMPVTLAPGGIAPLPEEGGVREKLVSAMRTEFRAMAEAHGRPGALAEAMVDEDMEIREVEVGGARRLVTGKEYDDLRERGEPVVLLRTVVARGELLTLSASQAIELGFADGRADSLPELCEKIGRAGVAIEHVERSRSEDVVAFLDRIAPLLIIAGLMLAFTEIKTPGFGLAGVLAIACFAVLLVGRYLAGLADVPHIVMVAAGVVLIAVEIFVVPGTLWVGLAGGLLAVAGLILASLGPGFGVSSPFERSMLLDATFRLFLSALAGLAGALILSRFLPRTPVLRGLVLDPDADAGRSAMRGGPVYSDAPDARPEVARVGAEGTVLTDLRPVGKVRLDAAPELELEARASGGLLSRGTRVRVVEVGAGRVVVEPLPAEG